MTASSTVQASVVIACVLPTARHERRDLRRAGCLEQDDVNARCWKTLTAKKCDRYEYSGGWAGKVSLWSFWLGTQETRSQRQSQTLTSRQLIPSLATGVSMLTEVGKAASRECRSHAEAGARARDSLSSSTRVRRSSCFLIPQTSIAITFDTNCALHDKSLSLEAALPDDSFGMTTRRVCIALVYLDCCVKLGTRVYDLV